ncbi:unnamed protein product [Durusdinium trenchii]|uniref:Uncharacterized protein n=1 Tax=Durusdinium trenchii TaxID=1381693 RepID=A0ABP0K1A6_9DINO
MDLFEPLEPERPGPFAHPTRWGRAEHATQATEGMGPPPGLAYDSSPNVDPKALGEVPEDFRPEPGFRREPDFPSRPRAHDESDEEEVQNFGAMVAVQDTSHPCINGHQSRSCQSSFDKDGRPEIAASRARNDRVGAELQNRPPSNQGSLL